MIIFFFFFYARARYTVGVVVVSPRRPSERAARAKEQKTVRGAKALERWMSSSNDEAVVSRELDDESSLKKNRKTLRNNARVIRRI